MRIRQLRPEEWQTLRRLRERAGFEPTGDRQPLPSRPDLSESRLRPKL